MTWLEEYIKRGKDIVRHGRGKLTLIVGPTGKDKTAIQIQAGECGKHEIDRYVEYIDDD